MGYEGSAVEKPNKSAVLYVSVNPVRRQRDVRE
jgi:hypothetical protein